VFSTGFIVVVAVVLPVKWNASCPSIWSSVDFLPYVLYCLAILVSRSSVILITCWLHSFLRLLILRTISLTFYSSLISVLLFLSCRLRSVIARSIFISLVRSNLFDTDVSALVRHRKLSPG
jgi:hypothetical protein